MPILFRGREVRLTPSSAPTTLCAKVFSGTDDGEKFSFLLLHHLLLFSLLVFFLPFQLPRTERKGKMAWRESAREWEENLIKKILPSPRETRAVFLSPLLVQGPKKVFNAIKLRRSGLRRSTSEGQAETELSKVLSFWK